MQGVKRLSREQQDLCCGALCAAPQEACLSACQPVLALCLCLLEQTLLNAAYCHAAWPCGEQPVPATGSNDHVQPARACLVHLLMPISTWLAPTLALPGTLKGQQAMPEQTSLVLQQGVQLPQELVLLPGSCGSCSPCWNASNTFTGRCSRPRLAPGKASICISHLAASALVQGATASASMQAAAVFGMQASAFESTGLPGACLQATV